MGAMLGCPRFALLAVMLQATVWLSPASAVAASSGSVLPGFGDRGALSVPGSVVVVPNGAVVAVRPTSDDRYSLSRLDDHGHVVAVGYVALPRETSRPSYAGDYARPFNSGVYAHEASANSLFLPWGYDLARVSIDGSGEVVSRRWPNQSVLGFVQASADGSLYHWGQSTLEPGLRPGDRQPSLYRDLADGQLGPGTEFSIPSTSVPLRDSRYGVAVLADGVAVTGLSEVRRYDSSGGLAWSYQTSLLGIPGFDVWAYVLAPLGDGSIVVAGSARNVTDASQSRIAVWKLTADGRIDSSFGDGAGYTVLPKGAGGLSLLKVWRDGSILSGWGVGDVSLTRLTRTGALDSSFGTGGRVTIPMQVGTEASAFGAERTVRVDEAPNGDILLSQQAVDPCRHVSNEKVPLASRETRVIRLRGSARAGADLAGRYGNLTLLGPGSDRFSGTTGCDLVRSLGGNDAVSTGGGRDVVNLLGRGNSVVSTGAGNDVVDGPAGGFMVANGGAGNDILRARPSAAVKLVGGPGRDVLIGSYGVRRDVLNAIDGFGGDIVRCSDSRRPSGGSPDVVRMDAGDRALDCEHVVVVR
ncbi:MAG: enzyme repeat protein [Thermoleophilia bacterium]|nr:enzyme repeat protein [Thermoleophilia bacterium]